MTCVEGECTNNHDSSLDILSMFLCQTQYVSELGYLNEMTNIHVARVVNDVPLLYMDAELFIKCVAC